jgi:hypothetical protein
LRILNEDIKQSHQDLKNRSWTMKDFQPGDLVIVGKQVQSSLTTGVSAKLVFQSRGPYPVIDKLGNGTSYHILRLPYTKGNGIPGKYSRKPLHAWRTFRLD